MVPWYSFCVVFEHGFHFEKCGQAGHVHCVIIIEIEEIIVMMTMTMIMIMIIITYREMCSGGEQR